MQSNFKFILNFFITRRQAAYNLDKENIKIWQNANKLVKLAANKKIISWYSHNNTIHLQRNEYALDCTGFVQYVLLQARLQYALTEVQTFVRNASHTIPKPIKIDELWPIHYVEFLSKPDKPLYWNILESPALLIPGDLIAYTRFNASNPSAETGQHIMIVAARPDLQQPNTFWVPIFDATKKPHGSSDLRPKEGGIAKSTIGLILDEQGHLNRLKWSPDSTVILKRKIVMARIGN